MCGVAGFVSWSGPRDRDYLAALGRTMNAAQSHRGPDQSGVYVSADGTVMLATARLAVRDLSAAGHQPMTSPDGAVVLAYNGELYRNRGAPATAWTDAVTFVSKAYVRMDAADARTWFGGVRMLAPAHYLVASDPDAVPEAFWTVPVAEEQVSPEQVREAFLEAVRLRMPADVGQAALLSGGFDSSSGFGALCRFGGKVRPCVIRYEGLGYGQNTDIPYALEAAGFWDREPIVCEVRADHLPELIDAVVYRLGRPVLHGAELAMHCAYQRIAEEGATVVYSGHGADEMWGYQDGRYFPVVAPGFRPDMHSPYYLRHLLYRDERPLWHQMLGRLSAAVGLTGDITEQVWDLTLAAYRELDTLDPHKRGRYHLMRRFMVYVDEMVDGVSAGFSLEDRPLFQDVRLAELVFGMPEYIKNRQGLTDFKPFLKLALRDLVPESILTRPKKGFPAPDDEVFRGQLRVMLQGSGMPFGLDLTESEVAELGISELMFLYSARRWTEIYSLQGGK